MGSPTVKAVRYSATYGGFSLIEVLLAMVFLGFGFLSLVECLLILGRCEEETSRTVWSAVCAQEKVEELKSIVGSGLHTGHGEESVPTSCGTLERQWSVSGYPNME